MAIKIENKPEYDKLRYEAFTYRSVCPKCRTTVTYQGFDLLAHRNHPNGFIYCPKCHRPIPHYKDNAILDKEYYVANFKRYDDKTLSKLRTQKIIFQVVRPFAVLMGIFLMVLFIVILSNYQKSGQISNAELTIFLLGFFGGLGLTVASPIVFTKLIKPRQKNLSENEVLRSFDK